MSIERRDHRDECPYAQWYDRNAEYQPPGPVRYVVREIMVERCSCSATPDAGTPKEGT